MVLGWRRRKNKNKNPRNLDLEIVIPAHFKCPISLDLMKDPVTLSTGITYDRDAIERWFQDGNFTCPVTNQILTTFDLVPNHALRVLIQEWCVENRRFGIDRIPTPRVPVSPIEIADALLHMKASATRLDRYGVMESVQRIEKWRCESERNKRCIVENGAASVFSFAFHAFASSIEENASVLEEILCALNWMFPIQFESQRILGSSNSLRCIVWFLKHQDLSGKQNAIVALREILCSCDEQVLEAMAEIEGNTKELLVELINKRISPTITKASLMIVHYMVSSSYPSCEKVKLEFIELGLISSLLEILVDTEKSLCEKALGVFDSLCSCVEGREKAYSNALTIPILVKKILRVSTLATNYSVSAIWKLCRYGHKDDNDEEEEDEEEALVEALQVGAFQKLLVVLQVGCDDETKEKVNELLKLLNPYRAGLECIDSDFKNLKRSF
ncbi:U-box domain-containing protein 21-like [Senna tora]|uniref:U-box domain-containing protein n=1 Tax=Senna tora TaxID=362788 RepID=A0A834T458_9FABA|nr:U-box domain-containing protein 21-like [Senna tora]